MPFWQVWVRGKIPYLLPRTLLRKLKATEGKLHENLIFLFLLVSFVSFVVNYVVKGFKSSKPLPKGEDFQV